MRPNALLLFDQGVRAVQEGDRERGAALFVEVLRRNEQLPTAQHAKAWLWLAHCLDDAEEQRYCLQLAMEIDIASCDGVPMTVGAARRPRVFLGESALTPTRMLIASPQPAASPNGAYPSPPPRQPSSEAEVIARELAGHPDLLGRWLGYGARLVEEARSRKRGT